MKTTKTLILVAALCALPACTRTITSVPAVKTISVAPTEAPASVSGMKLVFSDNSTYKFPSGNSAIISKDIDPGYGNSVRYKKTGATQAEVEAAEWESGVTYNLIFTSATSGTATAKGCDEGEYWTKSGLTFKLMPL